MYNKFILSLCATLVSLGAKAQYFPLQAAYPETPKHETRAVWLTTFANLDWPKTYATSASTIEQQKQELVRILDQYQKANINTVILQARVRAATIYPSNIEPWDKCITGQEGVDPGYGYDPLKFAVEECHKRGMNIHAWIATIPAGGRNSLGCRMLQSKGFQVRNLSTGAYLDPSDPNVPTYLGQVCAEIAQNYDIDGINLDYIRYPDGWPKATYADGDTPDDRRRNITNIVRAIHDAVKAVKPWVHIACSPIGKYADLNKYSSRNYNAHDRVFQEAQDWLRMGLMDELYPMQYFRGTNYYPFLADWEENRHQKAIISGLGTYFLDPREGNWQLDEIKRQMNVSRSLGLGHAHYRSYFLTGNPQGIYDFEQQFNRTVSLPTGIAQKNTKIQAPDYVQGANSLIVSADAAGNHLTWRGTAPYYNIYAGSTNPVNISDPKNLVYAKYDGNSLNLTLPETEGKIYFAVTAIDRYGNESEALQGEGQTAESTPSTLLENDGNTLQLPSFTNQLNITNYIIKDNIGKEVRRIPTTGKDMTQVYIYNLPKGFYTLSALFPNSKTPTQIGKFAIAR